MLGIVGCASEGARRETSVLARPAMPTVVPPARTVSLTPSETETVANALAAARRSDFPALRQTLELLTDRTAQGRVGAAIVATLTSENPSLASAAALALPASTAQFTALQTAVAAWARQDLPTAVTWAMTITDPELATIARRAVSEELVRQDAAASLQRLRSLPVSTARDQTLSLAAAAWSRREADAALSWARSVDDEALRRQLTVSIVFDLAQHTPTRAIQIAETLPASQERGRIFSAIAQTWIATDAPAAMAWAQSLPAGELREAAFAGVDTGNGGAGLRRRTTAPRLGGSSRMGGTGVSAALPESNPPTFDLWLASQTRPMSRDEAIVEFIKQRGTLDVGAIGSWVTTLPGGPTRQRALEVYFDEILRGSPAAAANWLRSVPASDRSDAMVEEVARRWIQSEPGAAANWIRESNLPQFRKEELLRSLPR